MKKYIKLISVLSLTVLMCMSFCSCKQLDEMRNARAVYGDTEEILIFRGKEYKLLPECKDLNNYCANYGLITKSDVPLLLSDLIGASMYFDDEIRCITAHRVWSDWAVWCRTDIYDSVVEKINNYELNRYCYSYNYYDGDNEEFRYRYVLLSEAASKVLQNTLAGEGIELDGWDKNDISLEEIYLCDESLMFLKSTDSIALAADNGRYSFIIEMLDEQGQKLKKYPLTSENAEIIKAELGLADYDYEY